MINILKNIIAQQQTTIAELIEKNVILEQELRGRTAAKQSDDNMDYVVAITAAIGDGGVNQKSIVLNVCEDPALSRRKTIEVLHDCDTEYGARWYSKAGTGSERIYKLAEENPYKN